jgi:hypothetical protein
MRKKSNVDKKANKILALALDEKATDRDLATFVAEADHGARAAALRKLVEEINAIEEMRKRTEEAKSRLEKAMLYPPRSFLIGGEQLMDLLKACPEDHIIGRCNYCGYRGRITSPLCNRCGVESSRREREGLWGGTFLVVDPTDNVRKFIYGV